MDLSRNLWFFSIKSHTKIINLKISGPTWNEEFELPDGSYSVSDIQYYFKYFFKKHEKVTDNLSIMIQVNKKKIELRLK